MKKIAFVLRLFQDNSFHGGGEKIFYKLISKLIENHFLIDIYCSKSNVSEYPGINRITVVNEPYDHQNPAILENFYGKVKELVENKDYDFVISENITPPIDITFIQGHSVTHRKRKLKNFIESFLYNFRKVKSRRIKYENIWMKQGYRKIFVLSEILKNDIVENFNIHEDHIRVVYPGVDVVEPSEIRKISGQEDFTFGLSAPGFKRKGGYIFLKALKMLKEKGFGFKAKIIYPKYDKNIFIKILIKIYGLEENVEFIGFQNNMQDFYNSIDCLVMPSIEETFGLVALEAMMNKKLAIVSSYSGASEVLKDGYDSFVFDSARDSSFNLAEKMSFVLNNLDKYNYYAENGYKTAEIYNWDKTYNDFIKELESIDKNKEILT